MGHLIHPQPPSSAKFWYEGSSEYDGGGASEVKSRTNGELEDEQKPPAPTKEQYEKYGITKSHCSIEMALRGRHAAKPGERIYFAPGLHTETYSGSTTSIKQAQEFIGLGNSVGEVIIEVDYQESKCFSIIASGPVTFQNITFRVKAHEKNKKSNDKPGNAQGTGDDAIITLEGDYDKAPEYKTKTNKSSLTVKNCTFDLGVDCNTAYPTRVSGIFLKRGKSAVIEGCTFLGGAGSAIVAVNDPYLYTADIEITRNIFGCNGQPFFHEKSAKMVLDAKTKSKKLVPFSAHKMPGPSCLELWKYNRDCYTIRERDQNGLRTCETQKKVAIKMTWNTFESNLRAPFAYRSLFPAPSDSVSSLQSKKPKAKRINQWRLYDNLPSEDSLKKLVDGFDLEAKGNVMDNNGQQFDSDAICRMKGASIERKEKRIKTEDNDLAKSCKYPDGESLLAIQHYMSHEDLNSFPEPWFCGEPFEGFDEFVMMCPEEAEEASEEDDFHTCDY